MPGNDPRPAPGELGRVSGGGANRGRAAGGRANTWEGGPTTTLARDGMLSAFPQVRRRVPTARGQTLAVCKRPLYASEC